MSKEQPVVYAFIDSQNVNLAIREQGWVLDFSRFRTYLRDKFKVEKAYIFVGYMPSNQTLYTSLQDAGFECIFRPTLTYGDGKTKGNCDAELVLQAMIDFPRYDEAVIVTGDGDFYCLVKFLISQSKLRALLVPDQHKYSALLKLKEFRAFTRPMNDLRYKLSYLGYKKKSPHTDRPAQGTSSTGDMFNIPKNHTVSKLNPVKSGYKNHE
ncbi:MAG TPA: NYN domain-containing protein [Candidatus Saccharimonadales bacterium]|nr:NYN domain-containing protein [Candidatus Saccharimonadales bacterium]